MSYTIFSIIINNITREKEKKRKREKDTMKDYRIMEIITRGYREETSIFYVQKRFFQFFWKIVPIHYQSGYGIDCVPMPMAYKSYEEAKEAFIGYISDPRHVIKNYYHIEMSPNNQEVITN